MATIKKLCELYNEKQKLIFYTEDPYKTPYQIRLNGIDLDVMEIELTVKNKESDHPEIQIDLIKIETLDQKPVEVQISDNDLLALEKYLSSNFNWK